MKGYSKSNTVIPCHHCPRQISGITLAEVVISITIMALVASSVATGFIFMQKASIQAAYYTGAQRVLQSHVERIMSMPTENLVDQTIVNYNYSGLRVTTLSDDAVQEGLTNASIKGFTVYSNSGTQFMPYTTNVTEDAVLAYTTVIRVEQNVLISNTFNSTPFGRNFRRATITTLWMNNRGQTISNSIRVIRAEN